MYRHIPNGFVSPLGGISGAGISSLSNADGLYAGVQMTAFSKRLHISAYTDIESELAPISDLFDKQKNDYLATVRFKATDALELSATIRDNYNSNPPQDSILTGSQNAYSQTINIRFEASYDPKQTPSPTMEASLKTRYEYVRNISTSIKTGWLALEEVKFKIKPINSELVLSVARFETDSYNSAVWVYEPGLWGTGTNNALDVKGWRLNTRAIIHALKSFACSFNLSGSFYDNPRTIGSGLTAHMGTSDLSGAIQFDLSI